MPAKILLVDDDPTLTRFLGEYLVTQSFQVLTTNTGADALRVVFNERPDLVVLDVMMPGMDGWEVAARLREMTDIPIVLVTGKTTEADKLRGFNLGVDDYVTKPFSFAELTARIRAVLGRAQPRSAPGRDVIVVGGLRLDLTRRELRRGAQVIPLTPTEFRLLDALARNYGRAVAEADLISQVWGESQVEEATSLRRYIFSLRQKVEEDPANPTLILTLRGYGYRLKVDEEQTPTA